MVEGTSQEARSIKCFYHSADLDGKCSAAVVKHCVPTAELIPIDYGQVFHWSSIKSNDVVYMVDFALQPFSDMVKLNNMCNLIWIDHHKTAIEDYERSEETFKGNLRIGIGACALTWEWLSCLNVPLFIKLLAEYDVWDHHDPLTLPFQYGMRLYDTDPHASVWVRLLRDKEFVQDIVENGRIIINYKSEQDKIQASAKCFFTEFEGLECLVANHGPSNSKFFDSLWDSTKYDAMIMFYWKKDHWSVSLYTYKPDVDVSVIAKKYGGGGHKGAAGFQAAVLPPNWLGVSEY